VAKRSERVRQLPVDLEGQGVQAFWAVERNVAYAFAQLEKKALRVNHKGFV
jgi:hypothetical protein